MMKKIIFFVLTIFALSQSRAYAQTVYDISQISLKKTSNMSTPLLWGENTSKCVQVLGQPSSITDFYSEIEDATQKVYTYGANKLYFLEDKLVEFEISDESISIVNTLNGQAFRINSMASTETRQVLIDPGDPPRYSTETYLKFLDYPLSQGGGTVRGKAFKMLSLVHLKNGSTRLDYRFELLFNSSNKIFSISLLN